MSIVQSWVQTSDLFYRISSNQENLNLKTLIGNTLYDAKYRKRIIIDSGVTIGSNSTGSAALIIPSTATGGEIIIDNYGSIQGAGGAANGGTGGDAILAQALCRINNKSGGTIYAGGGGGGTGGTGGTGGGGSYQGQGAYLGGYGPYGGCCCDCAFGAPTISLSCQFFSGWGWFGSCARAITLYSNGGSGGLGGSGGRGRGYDGALALGSSGSSGSGGGTNAGTGGIGGTGGSGGDWGTSGSTGSTGNTGSNGNSTGGLSGLVGSSGGLAGFYINGLSTFVTLTNSGIVAGRTN
jgi:hypothetical protein